MKAALQRFGRSQFAGWLLYRLIRLYTLSLRLRVENEERWRSHLDGGGTVLLSAWHQQFFSAIRHFRKYRRYRPSLMISRSGDGDIIAAVARRTGWHPVRGSSSRGGRSALAEMTSQVKSTRFAAHIVDGPKGPAFRVKPGLIKLAHATRAVVVPFYVTAERAWYARSWDRFLLPKPFTRVVVRFDEPIELLPTVDPEEFERQRLTVESRMRAGGGTSIGEDPTRRGRQGPPASAGAI